jgi:hypothetical protein
VNNDDIFDTPEAARFLKVPPRTLEGWRYRGEGPAFIRYNHASVRYRRSDLEQFLNQKTVVPGGDNATA